MLSGGLQRSPPPPPPPPTPKGVSKQPNPGWDYTLLTCSPSSHKLLAACPLPLSLPLHLLIYDGRPLK